MRKNKKKFSAPAPQKPALNLGGAVYYDFGGLSSHPVPTVSEIRERFKPAKTLGAPEDIQIAMDSQLEECGAYSLLQHSFELGMAGPTQFMGYGALQTISQNGLIRACVETVADDMTRAWVELNRTGELDKTEEDEQITKLTAALKKQKLQTVFHNAAELVGYEGGAFIFIDTGRTDSLLDPLDIGPHSSELVQGGTLRFIVVDPVNMFPGDYDSLNPLSETYYQPKWWWVLGKQVHASRLIRLVAEEVPILLKPAYNFLGIPQAQILWDYVMHFQEVRIATQRMLTKFSMTVLKTNMEDILTNAAGTVQLDRRVNLMAQYRNNDGVLVVDKNEDVIKLETPIGGMTDIVKQSLEILTAINRTPAVKILGISPAGFNATGESDIRNYYDHIKSRQEKVLRDGIQKAIECLQINIFGEIDETIGFDFAPLGGEDRMVTANLQKMKADLTAVYLDRDVISVEEARKILADDPKSPFSDIDPDDIPKTDEDNEESESEEEGGDLEGVEQNNEEGEAGAVRIDDVDKAGAVYA